MGLLQTFYCLLHSNDPRDTIRKSYHEHRSHSSLPAGTPPHRAGLYGALRDWYVVREQAANEILVWAELTPFLLMNEDTSCEAFTEYLVYKEFSNKAHTSWLTQIISASLRLPALSRDSPRAMAALAMIKNVAWCKLLEGDVQESLQQEMAQLRNALDDSKLPLPEA